MSALGTPGLVRGLLPEDPFVETYFVRPGGATVFALGPDERMTVVDTRGDQAAEVSVLGADGRDDAAALDAKADAPATVIRAALADRNGSLLAHELGSRGLDPADATAIRLFGEWSPAGSAQTFRAEHAVTVVVAAPAGRIVDGAPPPSELLVRLHPARARGRARRRAAAGRGAGAADGDGRGPDVGLRARRMDEREGPMSKIAFCFPGQGSLEEGMGREIAEAFPAARDVYRIGSEATGLDLEKLCFSTPLEQLVDTEVQQPALVATSLAILAAMRERGLEADVVVGHSVGEFAALAAAGTLETGTAIGLVRERGLAMAEAARQRPGAMAAILGLADEEVEKLCRRIVGVWPANYNCPGQIVVSGEHEAVEECCAEAASLGARRAVMLKVSGAFHSPLVAKAADRLRPALERVKFSEPLSPFMSTVTAKIEPAQRVASLLVDQLTGPVRFTQAATELIRSGATTFVEVGPGNVLSGLVKRIDRGVKTMSVNSLESLERAQDALAR